MVIDNGNHLLLSGNHAALAYLETIGSAAGLAGPPAAEFAFMDLASGERWTLRINAGRLPWWIFDGSRRVPGTSAKDYLWFARLLYPSPTKTICAAVKCAGTLYQRLARLLWLAALNIEPKEASASLAGAVLRETLAAGGKACRPLIARDGLGEVFVTPALHFLSEHGAKVVFGHRLRALGLAHDKVTTLDFGDDNVATGDADVILAVPPTVAAALVPELATPAQFRAIVNAHFRLERPVGLAPITGIVNGTIEWLFTFPGPLSVTISAPDRLLDIPRETLAKHLWQEAAGRGLPALPPPPWQIGRGGRGTLSPPPRGNTPPPAPPPARGHFRPP